VTIGFPNAGKLQLRMRRVLIPMIAVAWISFLASADPGSAPHTYAFHMESQPLGPALQELAKQSGVQIIFFSRIIEGLRAPALDGRYTLPDALERLLSGSKLTFHVINANTIEIRPLAPTDLQNREPGSDSKESKL
jgi:iron complex outermembrane recepter protein